MKTLDAVPYPSIPPFYSNLFNTISKETCAVFIPGSLLKSKSSARSFSLPFRQTPPT